MANPNRRSAFSKITEFISLEHVPGPRGIEYLKFVRIFQKDVLGAFIKVNQEYGAIGSFPWPMNSVIIYSPELVKSVLVDNSKSYIKGEQIEELRSVVGNGLATNNDYESWLKSRALLSREFNTKAVASFIQDFKTLTQNEFSFNQTTEIDICEKLKLLTFNIACKTFLGVDLSNTDAKKVNDAVHFTSIIIYKRIFEVFPIPYWMPTVKNVRFNYHYNNLNNIVMGLIEKEQKNSSPSGKSILQKLVHAKDVDTNFSFSDNELRDEILTLLLAGHETSAHTLTWVLGLLSKHQDIQEKLFLEISINEDVSLESMPYLKSIILEGMRLYPAFPVLSRKTGIDIQLGEYKLPKNTNVVIPIYVMQRNFEYWENALDFRPERFLDEGREKSYVYMPFSKGHRRCIAELFAMTEMAVIIVEIIKKFKIELVGDFPREEAAVSLKPVGGMPVRLIPR